MRQCPDLGATTPLRSCASLPAIHEEWERTGDASLAVRNGLATTGRVITAAAVITEFGLGLAIAVLLDAVIIRCLLVPAIMELAGERAWWLPSWLARRLPRLALESG